MLLLQLVEGAEAKAMFGLAVNYKPLRALVETLERDEVLTGDQVADILEANGAARFPDPFVEGFGFDENQKLVYPGMPKEVRPACSLACSLAHPSHKSADQHARRKKRWISWKMAITAALALTLGSPVQKSRISAPNSQKQGLKGDMP